MLYTMVQGILVQRHLYANFWREFKKVPNFCHFLHFRRKNQVPDIPSIAEIYISKCSPDRRLFLCKNFFGPAGKLRRNLNFSKKLPKEFGHFLTSVRIFTNFSTDSRKANNSNYVAHSPLNPTSASVSINIGYSLKKIEWTAILSKMLKISFFQTLTKDTARTAQQRKKLKIEIVLSAKN